MGRPSGSLLNHAPSLQLSICDRTKFRPAMASSQFFSYGEVLVQFVHDTISNLDGDMNRGHKQTDLIIMVFAKAFDKVPHRRPLHKLDYYGIRGSTYKWISSWISTGSIRWSSLRSSPSVIRCTPRISFRTDPVPYFYK